MSNSDYALWLAIKKTRRNWAWSLFSWRGDAAQPRMTPADQVGSGKAPCRSGPARIRTLLFSFPAKVCVFEIQWTGEQRLTHLLHTLSGTFSSSVQHERNEAAGVGDDGGFFSCFFLPSSNGYTGQAQPRLMGCPAAIQCMQCTAALWCLHAEAITEGWAVSTPQYQHTPAEAICQIRQSERKEEKKKRKKKATAQRLGSPLVRPGASSRARGQQTMYADLTGCLAEA